MKKIIATFCALAVLIMLATSVMAAEWKGVPPNGKDTVVAPGITFFATNDDIKEVTLTIEEDAAPGTLTVRRNEASDKTFITFVSPDDFGEYSIETIFPNATGSFIYLWEPAVVEEEVWYFESATVIAIGNHGTGNIVNVVITFTETWVSNWGNTKEETKVYTGEMVPNQKEVEIKVLGYILFIDSTGVNGWNEFKVCNIVSNPY